MLRLPVATDQPTDQPATGRPTERRRSPRRQEAIRDEWLAPLVAQIREQAEEAGRLRAEGEDDRRLAGQLVDLLQAERDELRAEVERLRAGGDAVVTRAEPAHGADQPEPTFRPLGRGVAGADHPGGRPRPAGQGGAVVAPMVARVSEGH